MRGRHAPDPGAADARVPADHPTGEFVRLDGETHYRIAAYDRLEPFLVSVASDTDLWMFVASGGGLTAGRVDAEGSLFPYRTVDQLHDDHHHTGPLTLVRVEDDGADPAPWQPFAGPDTGEAGVERNLYKNIVGNRIVFEEIEQRRRLSFRYAWSGCDELGWVRTATLANLGAGTVRLAVLDGLRNILPYGAPLALYQQSSNLVDAYRKSEVDPESGLGIFSLTAGITDRAEAAEVLRANTVWCHGLAGHRVHLSRGAVGAFRSGRVMAEESVLNGARGNYLVSGSLVLAPGETATWHLVADTGRDHGQIAGLRRRILAPEMAGDIVGQLRQAGENLSRIVASADGLQATARLESASHHFSNVLYNCMRGGVFAHNDDIPVADFRDFLAERNRPAAARLRRRLEGLPDRVSVGDLLAVARESGDPDFARLGHEYLPLYFGRRHGDPSRPWNRFSIRVRGQNGERALHYEGNWRDIFQNWEALATSFPGFLPNIIAKFVNASTVDGFNPYRLTRDGVDWEIVEPEDPWSNIGYWGDHQIIYLLKLLEAAEQHDPALLRGLLGAPIFSYAAVPYRIRPYLEILRDQSDTIEFDEAQAALTEERVAALGADGKLVPESEGAVRHVNLLEKLLVPALSKLSNLIPDAGIWMNTQRPEWNDANNALGGGGVSVVTLCYLRRYLVFVADLLERTGDVELPVSAAVVQWLGAVEAILAGDAGLPADDRCPPCERRRLMDRLGKAFCTYRKRVYDDGLGVRQDLAAGRVASLFRSALRQVDRSLAGNRRQDGLYHTYNLLEIADGEVGIVRLQEMLEGQVAVLSSGLLTPDEALDLLERLFASELYRARERSFMLYPERELPGFLARNVVPGERAETVPLLADLLADGDPALLSRDADGVLRFHGDFANADDLAAALDRLAADPDRSDAVARDRQAVLDLFEEVFRHHSYTGRSGVMYAYEGLGCIYWHMVAKLLLAVQENVLRAADEGASAAVQEGLVRMYYRVRAGIGYEKTVSDYGAFPFDPYSHTPPSGGAKQPGMTGQVKEEILTRLGELGIRVQEGAVCFRPLLLGADEFLAEPGEYRYFDVSGRAAVIPLPAGSLAFSYCQVPVVYRRGAGETRIRVAFTDGTTAEIPGDRLEAELGSRIHGRDGRVGRIDVELAEGAIRAPDR